MKIPISNLYYILLYAWDHLEQMGACPTNVDKTTPPANLFGRVLLSSIEKINRRGIHHGYVEHCEEARRLKGKFDLTLTMKRALLEQGKVACRFDEFTPNTLPNQIIRTVAERLMNEEGIDKELSTDLRRELSRWTEVETINLDRRHFSNASAQRQNRLYGFLMKLCEMIYSSLIPLDDEGTYRFEEFDRDEEKMRKVFEDFVRNFYRIEQKRFSVSTDRKKWRVEEVSEGALKYFPLFETDTSLTSDTRRIIIETKYVEGALDIGRYGKPTLRSKHLYQLTSYLKNLDEGSGMELAGVLLYPSIDSENVDLKYTVWGYSLRIRSLNLGNPWENIRKDLLEIAA